MNNIKLFSTSLYRPADIDNLLKRIENLNKEMNNMSKKIDEKKQEDKIKEEREMEEARKIEELKKLAEQQERDKPLLSQAEERINKLKETQEKITDVAVERLSKSYEKLDSEKGEKILDQVEDGRLKILLNTESKLRDLDKSFEGEIKSVAYFQKKVDIEAAGAKKLIQSLEKEEKVVHEELQKEPNYNQYKDKYEADRSKWKQEHDDNVRSIRLEKQDIKKQLDSNLEKASEMSESLVNETGPDYTGGDD